MNHPETSVKGTVMQGTKGQTVSSVKGPRLAGCTQMSRIDQTSKINSADGTGGPVSMEYLHRKVLLSLANLT